MCMKIRILFQKSFQPNVVYIQTRPKNELCLGWSEIEKWNHAGHDLQTSNVRRKFEIWRDIQEKNTGFISRYLVSKILNNAINSEKKEQISPKLKNGSLYNNGLPEAKSLLEVKMFYVLESAL